MGDHGHENHQHEHEHGHGHANDQGLSAMLRYLRHAPQMWRSEVNDAVVDLVAPAAGEVVVDIGAGMGPATVRAARMGASVIAVEPTPFMRVIVNLRRLAQKARSRITVSDGGAEQLPMGGRTADAAWAVNSMHHWIDAERAADEIFRVLRPGGRIVLVDEDFADRSHPDFDRWGPAEGENEDQHHGFTMVDADQLGDLLRAAGLVEVHAIHRKLVGRPVIEITGRAPAEQ